MIPDQAKNALGNLVIARRGDGSEYRRGLLSDLHYEGYISHIFDKGGYFDWPTTLCELAEPEPPKRVEAWANPADLRHVEGYGEGVVDVRKTKTLNYFRVYLIGADEYDQWLSRASEGKGC